MANNTDFSSWWQQLNEIARNKGFDNAGDPSKWRDEFDRGLSPADAWNGDWDLY
ncbi:hypothetical protein HQN64_18985 [Enterobacteriaceae bacterium BIT-l23]|uniref:hypothetical protein n=1 Tax=Jejubacter sp. L23 TaxID=3092086 RepID=UPI0015845204|nr:hypothetical protein [Enterobacteriaceae bacterium BIT-l23]